MIQTMVLTLIFLIGAIVGFCFLEGFWLRGLLYILGCSFWFALTFYWWFYPLLEKWIK